MLKDREKLDILERYCGVHSELFEWIGKKGPHNRWEVRASVRTHRVSVFLGEDLNVRIKFYPTLKGTPLTLFVCGVTHPDGMKRCEEKIGSLLKALELEKLA